MNMKKTLAGVAAGAMALSAVAVSASAAQEARTMTITLETAKAIASGKVDAEIYGTSIENLFDVEGTYEFNFNILCTLPKKYKESADFNWLVAKEATNLEGKSATLIVEGYADDAKSSKITREISLQINEDGYYEFEVEEAGTGAVSRKVIAADTFTGGITSINLKADVSFETSTDDTGLKYVTLPSDAIGTLGRDKTVYGDWGADPFNFDGEFDNNTALKAAFEEFAKETFTLSGSKTDAKVGKLLETSHVGSYKKTGAYDIDDLYDNAKIAIVDTIGQNKGATITFNFITADSEYGLEWLGAKDDANIGAILDVSYDTLKKFVMGINLENTRALQFTGDVVDNSVVFDWDTIMAKSGLSAASGDIDSIHVRTSSDVVLGSIVVKIPEIADPDDNTPAAGDEAETVAPVETDATEATEVTTVATEAAPNAPTGNAPIALAAIPVALAAAAIVAKKRG